MKSLPSPRPGADDAKEKHAGLSKGIFSFFSSMQNVDQISNHAFKKVIHITDVLTPFSYRPAKEPLHIISITGPRGKAP